MILFLYQLLVELPSFALGKQRFEIEPNGYL